MADLVWLFFFDRMGIFKILGAILDDYAIKGKLPISNGSVNAPGTENKDDLITIVIEAMTRKTKIGTFINRPRPQHIFSARTRLDSGRRQKIKSRYGRQHGFYESFSQIYSNRSGILQR